VVDFALVADKVGMRELRVVYDLNGGLQAVTVEMTTLVAAIAGDNVHAFERCVR
jgi:hypothetical protein